MSLSGSWPLRRPLLKICCLLRWLINLSTRASCSSVVHSTKSCREQDLPSGYTVYLVSYPINNGYPYREPFLSPCSTYCWSFTSTYTYNRKCVLSGSGQA
ncbi:hypothetical protein B0J14DRAFT_55292 [Halenospora varia]|nr:hypothetical protein B0J14DRAFT_55292 [Halenospora varia]